MHSGRSVIVMDLWAGVAASFARFTPLASEAFTLPSPYQSQEVSKREDGQPDEQEWQQQLEGQRRQEQRQEQQQEARRQGPPRKRSRRRRTELNEGELAANRRHEAIAPALAAAASELAAWRSASGAATIREALGVAVPLAAAAPAAAVAAAPEEGSAACKDGPPDWVAMASLVRALKPRFEWADEEEQAQGGAVEALGGRLFGRLIANPADRERVADAGGHRVLLPPRSAFLMSDFKQLAPLLEHAAEGGFHCIVLDPPWESKSVWRGAQYATLPSRNLLALPLQQLMSPTGCLVCLWVTNRERHRRFIDAELLPAWGLRQVGAWHWLKVADDGRPVSPLDVAHRRPYESLLLCCPAALPMPLAAPAGGCPPGAEPPAAQTGGQAVAPPAGFRLPPVQLVLAAVPAQHSRKPHLGPLLAPHLPPQPRCLEMFARELAAGWTSWGNEVLHFQGHELFCRLPVPPRLRG